MVSWQSVADSLTQLPYWLARTGSELDKLRLACVRYWQRLEDALNWPALQIDPLTAELELVHLLAWERSITRLTNEPEFSYRRRVSFALANASDAGSKAGFERIFNRLELDVAQRERPEDDDWDVVRIEMPPETTPEQEPLLQEVVNSYGRTCRRYQLSVSYRADIELRAGEFNAEWQTQSARLDEFELVYRAQISAGGTEFNSDWQLYAAKLEA